MRDLSAKGAFQKIRALKNLCNLVIERTSCLLCVFDLQLEKKHDILIGTSPLDLKRKNALTNALIDLLGEKSGADTLLARECMLLHHQSSGSSIQPRDLQGHASRVCMAA